jgi:NTP pyrophosphatase (non-canonical NTP hydrolase)
MTIQEDLDNHFISELRRELERARTKFPSANFSTLALVEEVGELAQAVLKVRAGKAPATRIFDEALQVAAMAMRVALETDESLTISYTEPTT